MGEEKRLRDKCSRWLKTKGGVMLPLKGWLNGTPDALVVSCGKVHLVEFKALNGKLSAGQELMAKKIAQAGFRVNVIRTLDEFKEMLK